LELEEYFDKYRRKTIGIDHVYRTYYGERKMIYADWAASGRLYRDIEDFLVDKIGVLYGNTHSEDNYIGKFMNNCYYNAKVTIKKHVKADDDYVVLTVGYGMTAAVHRLQEIMGLYDTTDGNNNEKPIVFLTHMEHHSNYTTWLELNADFEIINQDESGRPSLEHLESLLKKYNSRRIKIGSFSACSNITGIRTDYYKMAALMHKNNGVCFVDFSASAPYENMDVKCDNQEEMLDAIFFSPHKFLGGPGSSGVLIFRKELYSRNAPTIPGGGTILWTNPWGGRRYFDDIENREDSGTPGILQTIKAALAIQLKENMNLEYIQQREKQITDLLFSRLEKIDEISIYEKNVRDRLGIISFNIDNLHYKLVVSILSAAFGIQARGGCSCSGLYGHYLLKIDKGASKKITDNIDNGNMWFKPGWVRLSLNPIMSNDEVFYIAESIKLIIENREFFLNDYTYCKGNNTFVNKKEMNSYSFKNIFV